MATDGLATAIPGTAAVAAGGGADGTGAGGSGTEGAGDGGTAIAEIEPTGGEGAEGNGSEDAGGEGEGGEGEPAAGEEGAGEGEGEKAEEGDGSEFETDGRKIDDKTKKALAALKKVDPAAAKLVADAYFRHDAYKKVFPTVQDARGAKATIDALGGHEGIQAIQDEVGDYRNEITEFAKGDPALIQKLWDANPEGVELSTAASIELLASKDLKAFDRVIAPAMVSRLEQAGFYAGLTKLAEHLKAGDGQAAYDLLKSISDFFGEAKAMSKKQLDLKKTADPERQKLDQEKQEFEQQKTKDYEGRIATNANTLNNQAMSKIVEPFFKEMKIPTDGRREFIQGLQNKVWSAMKADKTFQMQARAVQKKGDAGETAEFISGKFQELLPGIFRSYRNSLYPNYASIKTSKPAATNGKTAPAASVKDIVVPQGARPRHNDVSWASDGGKTTDIDWMRGIAHLKNGKTIKFDRNAPPNRM